MEEIEDCLTQVFRMALAAMQSHTFWLHTRPDDSPYEPILKRFGHFFYATNEAHLTMMIVSLDCLYDDKPNCLNFQTLLKLVASRLSQADLERISRRVNDLRRKAKGVRIIRNNSFAHVATSATRDKLGEKHAMSHEGYSGLCYDSLEVAVELVRLVGSPMEDAKVIVNIDLEQIKALYAALSKNA